MKRSVITPVSYQDTTYFTVLSTGEICRFDGVVSVRHVYSLKLSVDSDLSEDAQTAESAKNEPDEVTLEAVMSDVGGAVSALTSAASASGLTRSAAALSRLYSLKRDRTPLSLTTPLRVYPRMLLQNISVTSEAGQCHGFTASVTFREIPESYDGSGASGKSGRDDNASSTVRRGRAEPTAASTSVAKRLLDKLGSRILS